jgi:hypothetical protein
MSNEKRDIYDVDKYTDQELYEILDLNNPTDRELEAKLHILINKYEIIDTVDAKRLQQFFYDIYARLFELSEEDDEGGDGVEGFVDMVGTTETSVGGVDITPDIIAAENKPKVTDLQKNVASTTTKPINYTQTFEYTKGQLNPLLKETIKRVINIDSRYRDASVYPSSTNFTFNLNEILRDVVSLKLYSITIPNTWYTIPTSYGVNFFYIKGASQGITDGNSDYKIAIPPGNYANQDLITAITTAINNLSTTYLDVNFGNTAISFNPNTLISGITMNIQKIYNDMYYDIYYPEWSDPTNVSNNLLTIPGFLGFNSQTYNTYTVYTNYLQSSSYNNTTTLYGDTTNANNYFNVVLYYGVSEYVKGTSTDLSSISVNLPTGTASLTEIVGYINTAFSALPALSGSTISLDTISIGGIQKKRYKMNVVINRTLIPSFNANMKAAVIFPTTYNNTVWVGPATIFNFASSFNELNNIYSETGIISSYYPVTNNPYMYLKCNTPYYGNGGIVDYPNGFNVTRGDLKTYNVVGNTTDNYTVAPGNYTIFGEKYTLINKKTDVVSGKMDISGTNYTITTSGNYQLTNIIGNVNISGNLSVLSGVANVSGYYNYSIDGTESYTVSGSPMHLNGYTNITRGNTNITGGQCQINGISYILNNTNMTGSSRVSGNTTIYTPSGSSYTVSGSQYQIVGSAVIQNTFNVSYGNVGISSTTPYTIAGQTYTGTNRFPNLTGIVQSTSNTGILNVSCTNTNFTGSTQILGGSNTVLSSSSDIAYTVSGENYTFVGNATVVNTTSTVKNGNIYSTSPYRINGSAYDISGTINVSGVVNVSYGNILVNDDNNYTIKSSRDYYLLGTAPYNLTGNINVAGGDVLINSQTTQYIINGNTYTTNNVISHTESILTGNTYTVNGHLLIKGTDISITGNVSVYVDSSLNDYTISVPFGPPNQILSYYLSSINTAASTAISTKPELAGSSIVVSIENAQPYSSNIQYIIRKRITGENFYINLQNTFFRSFMNSPNQFDGSSNTIRYTGSFQLSNSGYYVGSGNNIITINAVTGGLVSSYIPITVTVPPATYYTPTDLQNAINVAFNPNYPVSSTNTINNVNITNCVIQFTTSTTNTVTWVFTYNIFASLTEKDYSVYFYDSDLTSHLSSGGLYDNTPYFYSYIGGGWTNLTNTWYQYLKLSTETYDLGLNNVVNGTKTISTNEITLSNETNYFVIKPKQTVYGIPYSAPITVTVTDLNGTPLVGTYPLDSFIQYMNYTFSNIPELVGSTISTFQPNTLTAELYVKLRLNLNRVFKTSDFKLVFFDSASFSYCNTGFTGTKSIKPVEWDTTLGWLLGFRHFTEYNTTPGSVFTNTLDNKTYYTGLGYNVYSYNATGNSATLYSDTVLNVNIYGNFMIILEDYAQNHLNDGILTLAFSDNTIPVPSYANSAITTCDPATQQPVITHSTSQYNSLTANQLYAANQILNAPKIVYPSRGYLEDVFAVIPLSPIAIGSTYVVFGSTLQIQERSYFGPVNIQRMTIKLVTDKGNIVDLNGSDWSFSFICEKLYTQSK